MVFANVYNDNDGMLVRDTCWDWKPEGGGIYVCVCVCV